MSSCLMRPGARSTPSPGIEPSYLIEQDYEAFLKEEFDNWGSVIRSANVRKE